MAVVSDIEIRLRADIARLQQDMTQVRRTVDSGMNGVKKAADLAKAALGGLSIVAFLKSVVDAQREFDKLNASLITATGSTEKAGEAFSALQKFAASTPYDLKQTTEAFLQLRNLGLTPSERALTSFANTASAKSIQLSQVVEAVADAATGEFERLKEAFGITSKQIGDNVAFTFQGATTIVKKNSKDIQEYLTKIGEVQFGGAMERQANTLNGSIGALGDAWQNTLRKISQNGIGDAASIGVNALTGSLGDLVVILDAAAGKTNSAGDAAAKTSALQSALAAAFKGVAIVGVYLGSIFELIGDQIAATAAAITLLAKGDFEGVKAVIKARLLDAESTRQNAANKTRAILASTDVAKKAAEEEAEARKKSGKDILGQFGIELDADQKRAQAKQAILEIENKLNGVNAQTASDLAKLKTAYETGAITQAQYNKYVAQTNKEATEATTAYKNMVKQLDLNVDAIKRRADAQAYANQQTQAEIEFRKRINQLDEESAINQSAESDLKNLVAQKDALEAQRVIAAKMFDSKSKIADLNGEIDKNEKEQADRRVKQSQDLTELERTRYLQAVNNTADLIDAGRGESKAQQDRARDMQDEIDALGLTSKQLAEVTAARLRDQAAALDRRAEIGIIEEVNEALRRQADELRKQADLGITKERLQEQQKYWSDLDQIAHDTFVSIGDGGQGLAERLKNSLKNVFFDWLYQQTLKKWIINIGTSTDGAGAVAGLVSGGQSGGLVSAASSLFNLAQGNVGNGVLGSFLGGLNGAGVGSGLTSAVGLQLGNSIASVVGPSVAGALSTGLSAVATAVPWIGGVVAAYSLAKAAFGMGSKQYSDSSTLTGTLGDSFSGTVNTSWTQKGGWFRSDKNGVDKKAVEAVQAAGLTAAYDAIKAASTSYAEVLGLNADSIATRSQAVSIALGKDETANQKAIADFFSGVSDTIASEVLPGIEKFQASGETTSTTLARLANDFEAVNAVLVVMGTDSQTAFKAVGSASIEARERLISLAGGLDKLGTQTQYFFDNFLSRPEQVAILQKEIGPQLEALGYASLATTDDLKNAVNQLISTGALATEEGAKQYAGLLALAPKFKTVADYLTDVAKATEDAAKATEEAAKTAADAAKEALDTLLQGNLDSAVAALSKSVDAEKDRVSKAYKDAMAALDAQIAGVNDTISRATELSQALRSAVRGIDNPTQAAGVRAAAQAQVTAALAIARASGVMPSLDDLKGALSTLNTDASDQFSSLVEYQRDLARTNNGLEQLGDLTDDQLTEAQRQLQILQDTKTQAAAANEAELARLDNIANILLGVDTSVMNLAAAMASVKVAQAAQASSGNLTVEDLYRTVLGRDGEEAGVAFWKNAFGEFVDSSEYAEFIKGAIPELNMQKNQIPVVNDNLQYGTMSSSSANSDQQTFNQNMQQAMNRTANAVTQLADQFNRVSGGGNALATEQL